MSLLASPCVILVNPQLGENIGTCARAMCNFGLHHLRIVEPRESWPNPKALACATKASFVVEEAQLFSHLDEAVSDLHVVYATTARPREMAKTVLSPEQAGQDMRERAQRGERLGILFGRERWGLTNEEIALAHVLISAPVDPHYASLNIAQAVLLIAYEWYKTQAQTLGQATPERPALEGPGLPIPSCDLATGEQISYLLLTLENLLENSGFFKAPQKRITLMQKIRTLITRSPLATWEVGLLHGVFSALHRSQETPQSPEDS